MRRSPGYSRGTEGSPGQISDVNVQYALSVLLTILKAAPVFSPLQNLLGRYHTGTQIIGSCMVTAKILLLSSSTYRGGDRGPRADALGFTICCTTRASRRSWRTCSAISPGRVEAAEDRDHILTLRIEMPQPAPGFIRKCQSLGLYRRKRKGPGYAEQPGDATNTRSTIEFP